MTGAVPPTSPTSRTANTTTAQDIPLSNKSMDIANLPSFAVLIEDYHRINEELINQLKTLAESRQNNPPWYSVLDITTSRIYRRVLVARAKAKENALTSPFFSTVCLLFQKRTNPVCWRSSSLTLITAQALMFLGNLRGYFSQRGQR